MDDLDYKKLINEGREYLSLEMKYGKLTAVEKLSVLLSAIAFVAVIVIIGSGTGSVRRTQHHKTPK